MPPFFFDAAVAAQPEPVPAHRRRVDVIVKNLDRMGVPYERAEIEKLVADAKRRRESEGDSNDGPSLWYNDKVGSRDYTLHAGTSFWSSD